MYGVLDIRRTDQYVELAPRRESAHRFDGGTWIRRYRLATLENKLFGIGWVEALATNAMPPSACDRPTVCGRSLSIPAGVCCKRP